MTPDSFWKMEILRMRISTHFIALLLAVLLGSVSWGKTIGISNPTVKNLQRFIYLTEQGMLNSGDEELQIVGIFHEDQVSLIQASEAFVKEGHHDGISFVILKGETDPATLFLTNQWSDQFREIFEATDGFIFNGGPDIPPFLYGEETLLGTGIMKTDRLWELSLIAHLLGSTRNPDLVPLLNERDDYVVFGICLGMQELNVATGGSMYQDIPLELYNIRTYEAYLRLDDNLRHRNDRSKIGYLDDDVIGLQFHPLKALTVSFLSGVNGNIPEEIVVPSVHHQALKVISDGFEVVATSIDEKVAEGIQHRQFANVCGIQFHPEISELYFQQPIKIANDLMFTVNEASEAFYRSIWGHVSECLVKQR